MLRTSLALSIILSLYGVSGSESLSIISVPVSISFRILLFVIPGFLNGFLYFANTDGISLLPKTILTYSGLSMFWNIAKDTPLCARMFPVAMLPHLFLTFLLSFLKNCSILLFVLGMVCSGLLANRTTKY